MSNVHMHSICHVLILGLKRDMRRHVLVVGGTSLIQKYMQKSNTQDSIEKEVILNDGQRETAHFFIFYTMIMDCTTNC